MNKGRVFLVGAGPGDEGLLTVKGLKVLQKADVIVYDRLVNPGLLRHRKASAHLIYVGKSPEKHTLKQEEINEVLVTEALKGQTVVRLKGGDPFVFGRGGEEAERLKEEGIPFEIVPGITSALAVPAYAGIPVTHRGVAASFTVITGNEDPHKPESMIQWEKLATDSGTLVFLMGVENLAKIVAKLINNGKDPHTPVALVSWGTRAEQKTVTGILADIVEKIRKASLTSPAIIIVGQVVNLREILNWREKQPLFGKRVLITRARKQAGELVEIIEELGGEAWEFPVIRIAEPQDYGPLDKALQKAPEYDWFVFTSVNGVEQFLRRLQKLKLDIRSLGGGKICAIGPKTAEALQNKGLIVDCLPEKYYAEGIIAELGPQLKKGQKILLPRAEIARTILVDKLRELDLEVEEVAAYRTVPETVDKKALLEALQEKNIDVITFTSSSTVKNFVEILGEDLSKITQHASVACIGPITQETARSLGLKVDIVAQEYTCGGLVEAVTAYFGH